VSLTKDLNKLETHGNTTLKYSENYDRKLRYPRNVIYFNKEHRKQRYHPTQKPVALFEYLIKTYTNENELVLDNCIGSGTTAIACMQTNRNFIGMELEPKYCEIAIQRLNEAYRLKTLDKK
jgi:site-specific DNA-methyltransferase (adenine-specific)